MNTILSLFPLKIRISKKLLQNSMIKIRRFVWECICGMTRKIVTEISRTKRS